MPMQVITAFGFFVFLLFVFNIALRTGGKSNDKTMQDFLSDEHKGNYVRTKPIEKENFFIPNCEDYPFKEYNNVTDKAYEKTIINQARFLKACEYDMMKFDPPKSNLELKLEFGTNNLEFVANCEERFTDFHRRAIIWAESLIDIGQLDDAHLILENSIKDGCDFSKPFIILANMYYNSNDRKSLLELPELAKNLEILTRNIIQRYIDTKLNALDEGSQQKMA